MTTESRVAPEQWGRDHFSTLLYLEKCVVDRRGVIDARFMRAGAEHESRLRKGTLAGHDDYDCLTDLEFHELVVVTLVDGLGRAGRPLVVQMTPRGWRLAHLLRRRRGDGLLGRLLSVKELLSTLAATDPAEGAGTEVPR